MEREWGKLRVEGSKGMGEAKSGSSKGNGRNLEWKVEKEWAKLRMEGGKGMGEAKSGSSKVNGRN